MPVLRVEYAKSGRSKCSLTGCGKPIAKHEIRIGTQIVLPYDDGAESWKWRHLCCFTERQLSNAKADGSIDGIQGYTDLAPSDRKLVDEMRTGTLISKTNIIGRVGDVMNSAVAADLGPKPKAQPRKTAAKKAEGEAPEKKPRSTRPKIAGRGKEKEINSDADSEATEEFDVVVENSAAKPQCPYGENCFRTNTDHFEQYSHGSTSNDASENTIRKAVITGNKKRQRCE